jgi:hypothetical protein
MTTSFGVKRLKTRALGTLRTRCRLAGIAAIRIHALASHERPAVCDDLELLAIKPAARALVQSLPRDGRVVVGGARSGWRGVRASERL